MGFQLALSMDVSTMPFILAVLFGASSSFILPYGYQTNLMVYAAGNYKMPDYLKLALPVSPGLQHRGDRHGAPCCFRFKV